MTLVSELFGKFRTRLRPSAGQRSLAHLQSEISAIDRSQAVVEFALDGTILDVNRNYCDVLGYSRSALIGRHHSVLIDPKERAGAAYRTFWKKLGQGDFDRGTYKRIHHDGRVVWLQASYNPILDTDGRPFKVVKYATDVTAQIMAAQSISKVMTTIDDLAFHARMLALNTAIESAWNGAASNGFAAVAAEVGMLAQRSADSARAVRSLITVPVRQPDAAENA